MENGIAIETPAGQKTVLTLPWQIAGKGSRAFKGGLYGPPGSGKTTTSAILATYICKRLKKKEAFMLDSEGGADYVASIFQKADIELRVIRTREFGLLVKTFEDMKAQDDVVLVDSVTHFSDDVVKMYLKARKRNRMELSDFNAVYETWRQFSEPFMSSSLNAIVCGRMGSVYETVVSEEGKTEMYRTDSKMKASDQFGHEPDFLLEMEQTINADAHRQLQQATSKYARAKIAQEIKRNSTMNIVATVRKDRTRLVMGQVFTFIPGTDDSVMSKSVEESFKPVIDWHLKNKTQEGMTDTGSTSTLLGPSGNEFAWQEKKRRKDFALDEIKETFTKHLPGMSATDKQAKIEISEKVFGVKSWEGISQQQLNVLEDAIKAENGAPSALEIACIEKVEAIRSRDEKAALDAAEASAERKAAKGGKS